MNLEAALTLKSETLPGVGRERIRLLEAVGRCGSISAGAREVGLSYKAAWDGLDAMANLFGQRLIEAKAGGRSGGTAVLTPAGLNLIMAYHRLEAKLATALEAVRPVLTEAGLTPPQMLAGLLMETSARNALKGTIARVTEDAVNAEVALALNDQTTIIATVTAESVKRLGLVPGREAIALIKAPFVIIVPGAQPPQMTARNALPGRVARCHLGDVMAEVVVDIGEGRTIAATVTAESARRLALAEGQAAFAVFDAGHVLLAVG